MRALLVVAIIVLSGCLVSDDDPQQEYAKTQEDVIASALPFLSQHHGDDSDPSLHNDASLHAGAMNLEVVGYSNGVDNGGDPNVIASGVYYTELALHNGYIYLARGTAIGPAGQSGVDDATGGFVIIDVQDPATPMVVGEFQGMTGSDIEVSSDGDIAFFATQRNTVEEIAGGLQAYEDESNPAPRGIYIVDVRDKEQPELISFQAFPYNGPHTVTYWDAGGREFLFVQTYDFYGNTIPAGAASPVGGVLGGIPGGVFPVTQRVSVFEIQRDFSGQSMQVGLNQVAHFQLAETDTDGELIFPHDARVQVHPLRGEAYLYVAYWDRGVRIVNVDDLPGGLGTPDTNDIPLLDEVGSYTNFAPSSRNNIHLAMPFDELIDGKHITVTEPEIISAEESGYIHFVDTSTPSRPQLPCTTSHWKAPGDLIVQSLEFSPHNFDTWDGKVAMAHNHAGLWIIDVSNAENLCEPKTVGYFMDVKQRTETPRYQPYIWGAIEDSGLLYVSDESSGLYVLRYTGP